MSCEHSYQHFSTLDFCPPPLVDVYESFGFKHSFICYCDIAELTHENISNSLNYHIPLYSGRFYKK